MAEPGSPATYAYGAINSDVSVPIDYWLIGWLVLPPQVGEPLRILRIVRDGIIFPGHFVSTLVMEIYGHEIHTMNSIYRLEELC